MSLLKSQRENQKKDWHLLEFSAPIQEKAFINNEFIIRGTAINETVTHNNHKYIAEELEKAAPGLMGKPLLIDHDNSVNSIKGKVTNSFFDSMDKSIKFEAKVMDKQIREMIKDGRISNVSIGSFVKDLIKEEDGSLVAKGLQIVELSLVAVPSDDGANFTMAVNKSYQLKESLESEEDELDDLEKELSEENEEINESNSNKLKGRTGEMTKEKQETSSEQESKVIESLQKQNEKFKSELEVLKKEKRDQLVEKYKQLCAEKKVNVRETKDMTDEMLNILIDQLSDIQMTEKQDQAKMKSKVEVPKEMENFVYENNSSTNGVWIMPDVEKWKKNHIDKSFVMKTWQ